MINFREWYNSYWKQYPDEANAEAYKHQENAFNCLKALYEEKIKELEKEIAELKELQNTDEVNKKFKSASVAHRIGDDRMLWELSGRSTF